MNNTEYKNYTEYTLNSWSYLIMKANKTNKYLPFCFNGKFITIVFRQVPEVFKLK